MRTIFTSLPSAQAALAIRQQTPAQPGWTWSISKIAGMRMWSVCQTWNAAS